MHTFEGFPSSLGSGRIYPGWHPKYYFIEMRSCPEASSYLRRIDFVYHATLGLRVMKQKKKKIHSRYSFCLPETGPSNNTEITRCGGGGCEGAMKVDIRLPEKGNSNPHGARPVY